MIEKKKKKGQPNWRAYSKLWNAYRIASGKKDTEKMKKIALKLQKIAKGLTSKGKPIAIPQFKVLENVS